MKTTKKGILTYHAVQIIKVLSKTTPLTDNDETYIHCLSKALVRMTEHKEEHHDLIQEFAKEAAALKSF